MQFVSPPPSAGPGRLHRCLFEILHTARVASCVPVFLLPAAGRTTTTTKNAFFFAATLSDKRKSFRSPAQCGPRGRGFV